MPTTRPGTSGPSATGSRCCSTSSGRRPTRGPGDRPRSCSRLVTELYGAGLDRVVELARRRGPRAARRAGRRRAGRQPAARARPASRRPRSTRVAPPWSRCGPSSATTAATSSCSTSTRRRRRAPAPARQLRRLPVVGGDAAACRRAGDRRGRARDRDHRRGGADRRRGEPPRSSPSPSSSVASPSRSFDDRRAERPATTRSACCARIRRTPPRRATSARASAATCAPRRSPTSTATSSTSSSAACMCTCRGCYLLFTPDGAGGGRYRAVPDRYARRSPTSQLSPGQWDALQIPVSVAFFFVNSALDRVAAFYPSPAGATESLLSLDTWDEVVAANPELATLEPDVEAFLVRVDRDATRRRGVLPGADRRLLRARRPAAPALARLRRRPRGPRRARRLLRRRPGAPSRPTDGSVTARRSRCSEPGPSRTPRCPR